MWSAYTHIEYTWLFYSAVVTDVAQTVQNAAHTGKDRMSSKALKVLSCTLQGCGHSWSYPQRGVAGVWSLLKLPPERCGRGVATPVATPEGRGRGVATPVATPWGVWQGCGHSWSYPLRGVAGVWSLLSYPSEGCGRGVATPAILILPMQQCVYALKTVLTTVKPLQNLIGRDVRRWGLKATCCTDTLTPQATL